MAEKDGGALEEDVVQSLRKNLVAVHFAHIELEPRSDPWQRRIGELSAVNGSFGWCELFKVLFERKARQHSSADCPFETVDLRLKCAGRRSYRRRRGELALGIEFAVHFRLNAGGGGNVLNPFGLIRLESLGWKSV